MKKVIVGLVALSIAAVAGAELINWSPAALLTVEGSVVSAGWQIEMYKDVNGDNGATYFNDMVLDKTGAVHASSLGSTLDDVLFGQSTVSFDAGGGNVIIQTVANVSVSAADNLYTVIFNAADKSLATQFAVFETTPYVVPAGVGVSLPAGTMGVGVAAGSWQTVVPEPATFGLMGVAGLGMFLARRKARR